jgi:hypothetical protein
MEFYMDTPVGSSLPLDDMNVVSAASPHTPDETTEPGQTVSDDKAPRRVNEIELERVSRRCNTLKQEVTRNKKKQAGLRKEVKQKFYWLVNEDETGTKHKKKVRLDSVTESLKRREIERLEIDLIPIKAELSDARKRNAELNSALRGQNKLERGVLLAKGRLGRDPENFYNKVRIKLGKASKNGHTESMKGLKVLATTDPLAARASCMKVLEEVSPADAQLLKSYPLHREKLLDEIFGPLPDEIKNRQPEIF